MITWPAAVTVASGPRPSTSTTILSMTRPGVPATGTSSLSSTGVGLVAVGRRPVLSMSTRGSPFRRFWLRCRLLRDRVGRSSTVTGRARRQGRRIDVRHGQRVGHRHVGQRHRAGVGHQDVVGDNLARRRHRRIRTPAVNINHDLVDDEARRARNRHLLAVVHRRRRLVADRLGGVVDVTVAAAIAVDVRLLRRVGLVLDREARARRQRRY